MCGLVGMAGTLDRKHVDAFNDLMIFNIPRGRDSAGVASCDRDQHKARKDCYIVKSVGHALDLADHKGYDRVVNSGKVMLIGHGRSATRGTVNKVNAHPFVFDDVIGAHNGTIYDHAMKDLEDHDKFGTDSEALYYNINKYGVEDTIGKLTGGAYALTWYDRTDHSINFLRNSERPLCYSVVDDDKVLMWASENDILHAAAGRNGRNIKTEGNTWWLPEDTWYKFHIPKERDGKFQQPIEKTVKRKEAPAVQQYQGHTFRGQHERNVGNPMGQLGSVPPEKYASLTTAKVVNFDTYKRGKKVGIRTVVQGWGGRQMSMTEFKNQTGETCQYSDDIVTWNDVVTGKAKIVFINETMFVKEEYNDALNHAWLGHGLVKVS